MQYNVILFHLVSKLFNFFFLLYDIKKYFFKGVFMNKTICELFAGVGGFRLGFEREVVR